MNPREILEQARDTFTVRRVFGEPIERDGLVLVPVAAVQGGAGAGGGEGRPSENAPPGSGAGGGWGGSARRRLRDRPRAGALGAGRGRRPDHPGRPDRAGGRPAGDALGAESPEPPGLISGRRGA